MDTCCLAFTSTTVYTPKCFTKPQTLKPHFLSSKNKTLLPLISHSTLPIISSISTNSSFPLSTTTTAPTTTSSSSKTHHWIVSMDTPPPQVHGSKPDIINYYVNTLQTVIGNERDAQMCIYDASVESPFGFSCNVDEDTSRLISRLPGVLSVRPDPDYTSTRKDYSHTQLGYLSSPLNGGSLLFPSGTTKHWLVRMDKPGVGVVTKAQMVDYYAQILTKVLGNEKDAQMCIYHVSWKSDFGFCCELDDDCARELAEVPGVLSVEPDENFESENKNYVGRDSQNSGGEQSVGANDAVPIRTKKLFVTGLSFYTSEKTLRAAFEGFGELVEVKVIMDKISKRSKGYAFVEYTTEEAASAALKEMNGKIINGWMIVVDVARNSPPKYNRGRPRQAT